MDQKLLVKIQLALIVVVVITAVAVAGLVLTVPAGVFSLSVVKCTDTDGDINYYLKGTVTMGNKKATDSCNAKGILTEYYCPGAVKSLSIPSVKFNCTWGCVNGACNQPPECANGATKQCGSSIGACRPGTQTCANSKWGPCLNATGPSPETCNGIDDDCDGVVDEGCPPANQTNTTG